MENVVGKPSQVRIIPMTSESENPGELTGGNTIENPPEQFPAPIKKCVALGRPTTHDKAYAIDYICNEIMCSTYGLSRILKHAKKSGIKLPTFSEIMQWLQDDEEFSDRYSRAKQFQADFMFDELIDIADDSRNDWIERNDPKNPGWKQNGEHLARTKMRLDTRKWCAAKLRPHKYGERSDVNITQEFSLSTLSLDQLQQRLEALRLSGHDPSTPVIEALASAGDERLRDAEEEK